MNDNACLSKTSALYFFLFICALPTIFFAQSTSRLYYQPRSVNGFYDINDTNSLTVIDKIKTGAGVYFCSPLFCFLLNACHTPETESPGIFSPPATANHTC